MIRTPLPDVLQLAELLPTGEQRALVEHISAKLAASDAGKRCEDLRDAFAGRVPEDFDVEEALREIRSEWLVELEAIARDDGSEIP